MVYFGKVAQTLVYLLPLLLGTPRVTEGPSPSLLELPEININAGDGQKLRPIPFYVNFMDYSISRLWFLPIIPQIRRKTLS